MKNPLILISELFSATTASISLTETATLEFCYDHVIEDLSEGTQNLPLSSQPSDSSQLGIRETEHA